MNEVLKRSLLTAALAWALTALASPVAAHHSYANFDTGQVRTLTGTVEGFRWMSPHVLLQVRVDPEGGGAPERWRIETSGPTILKRFGWAADSIKPGDRVSVICNPRSDGSHGGHLHTLRVLQTGLTLKTKLSASD